MSDIPLGVLTMMQKFPEYKRVIQHLSKINDEFLTLCEDYRVCVEALRYWNISESDQATLRAREYQALLKELEDEIMLMMGDFKC